MPETNIEKAKISDYSDAVTDYSVDTAQTDGITEQKESTWQMTKFSAWLGYYKKIPELRMAIDALARWTIGKGFKASEFTELALMGIIGHGKDSFNSILENMFRTMHIAGDSFAEIIRDEDGYLINLKSLDPSTIKIVYTKKGIIKRYEQTSKSDTKAIPKTFTPEQIFHLSRNRTADEIHGISLVEAVEEIILMRNEAMTDYKKLLHRNIYPARIWHLDTDDENRINAFISKVQSMKNKGEDIFVPKGAVIPELAAVPPNATLNPLPWIQLLNGYFFQACGVPQIIVGGSQEYTEATAKIAYLAFEQTIEEEQLYVEEQVLNQLNLVIELEFPASLENEILAAAKKGETMQAATPEDLTATASTR